MLRENPGIVQFVKEQNFDLFFVEMSYPFMVLKDLFDIPHSMLLYLIPIESYALY